MHLVVRSPGDPLAIVSAVREQVRAMDRDQPIFNIKTMEEKLAVTIAPQRFSMILLAAFASANAMLARQRVGRMLRIACLLFAGAAHITSLLVLAYAHGLF